MPPKPKPEHEHEFLEEHIATRKEWGAYVAVSSKVRQTVITQADAFLADIHARLDKALRRQNGRSGR